MSIFVYVLGFAIRISAKRSGLLMYAPCVDITWRFNAIALDAFVSGASTRLFLCGDMRFYTAYDDGGLLFRKVMVSWCRRAGASICIARNLRSGGSSYHDLL